MPKEANRGRWEIVRPGIEMFRDSCNVYALPGEHGTLFVNAGSGHWIEEASDRFARPFALLCTHIFRDHSAGAAAAGRFGFEIVVPEGDLDFFLDPQAHLAHRENYIVYDNIWDNFVPIEPVAARPIADYRTESLAGFAVVAVPLPGVTPHHTGYEVTLADGMTAIFSGEAIHSPGRMARIGPLAI